MKVSRSLIAGLGLSTVVLISGCGGGGSSSSSTGSALPAITNAVEANATAENGVEAAEVILDGMESVGEFNILSAASTEEIEFDAVKFVATQNKIIKLLDIPHALNETFSESYECSGGGSISYNGSVTETNVNVTLAYDNCTEYDMNMNGTIRASGSGSDYGDVLTSMQMSFSTDLTVSYTGSIEMIIHQGSYMQMTYDTYDYYNDIMSGTMQSSLWFEAGNIHRRYDDLNVVFEYDYWNGSEVECYKGGRIYINNLTAYLDIDPDYDASCSDPFITDYGVLKSGSAQFELSDGKTILIDVTADDELTVTDSDGGSETIYL
jgi:hypothetical protein